MHICDATGTAYGACECAAGPGTGAPMVSQPGATGTQTTPGAPPPPPTATDTPPPPVDTMTPPPVDTMMPPTDPTMGEAGAAAPPPMDSVPVSSSPQCADVQDWDPMWTQFEDEVLELTNAARANGFNCDSGGDFSQGGIAPLTMNPELRCAARLHSMDMGLNDYFAHDSQDGRSPFDRMAEAGYSGGTMGENIAMGQQSPQQVVDGWLESDGHCSNMMNAGFNEIGIGFWQGESDNDWFNSSLYWTQNFGGAGGGNQWF